MLLFLLFGFNDLIFKLKSEFYLHIDNNSFLIMVYLAALALSILFILARRLPVSGKAVLLGLLLGLVNYCAAATFLEAVQALPGMIAYPLYGIAVIVFTTISSAIIWKERLKPHNYLFMAGSLAAIWLLF